MVFVIVQVFIVNLFRGMEALMFRLLDQSSSLSSVLGLHFWRCVCPGCFSFQQEVGCRNSLPLGPTCGESAVNLCFAKGQLKVLGSARLHSGFFLVYLVVTSCLLSEVSEFR